MIQNPHWLLLDVSQLVWASFHAIGDKLSYRGDPTYVHFGLLSSVIRLQQELHSHKVVFCFDYGKPIRCTVYPEYKKKRKEKQLSEEEIKVYMEVSNQIKLLREQYLPKIGFKNIFYQDGFEADDVIAKICKDYPDEKFIIVSNDQDMYQLLTKNVSIWKTSTKSHFTKRHFKAKYQIKPKEWAKVKAIAGCSSDEVAGVVGVGEITAVKYLKNELKKESKKHCDIVSKLGRKIYKRNLKLVKLPYKGVDSFDLQKDGNLKWKPILRKLGIRTLVPNDDFDIKGLRDD
jgi:DNA polymerase-1